MVSPLDTPHLPVVIRPVKLTDAPGLNTMCWPHRSLNNIMNLIDRTLKLVRDRRGLGVVAVWNDVPCGFGMLTLWPRAAEISDLIVCPQHRSRGIGSRIIVYLTERAREMHVQTLEIGVACANPRALALYRRLGFADRRTIYLDLGSGPEPVLYLSKEITATR